ncbi:MAG: hypothetical protein J6X77_01445 [Bacteroidales bacterium]|nr:hypothetical protein [Bacteroidales bacterium]
MNKLLMQKRLTPLVASLLVFAAACTPVEEYEVTLSEVDTEFSLFEEGLSVPIGSTNKLILGTFLNSAGDNLGDFLKTDASGRLILTYEGNTSLTSQIADLDLGAMATVDGVSFNKQFSYHIGDIDPSSFTIAADQVDVSFTFAGVESLDLEIDPIDADLDALNFKAGLDQYKDAINGNDDLKLSNQIGEKGYDREIERNEGLAALAALAGEAEFDVPKALLPDITVDETQINVTVPDIVLDENISAIRNIATKTGAKMRVSLRITNCYLSDGEIVPDVDLDLSQLLVIQGGSVIDLSGLALNPGNGWTASQDYIVNGLATTDYEGTISINENIVLEGTVCINDPKASSASLGATGNMRFEIAISFIDLDIVSADIAVAPVNYSHVDALSIGSDETYDLPDEVKTVKQVVMDDTKPIYLKITPKNLNRLTTKNIPYTIELTFPDGMDVQGATAGKLTLTGDLATGPVNEPIVIRSFTPTITNRKIQVNEEIGVNADFTATNLTMSSTNIPTTEDEDIAFEVEVQGTPAISNILLEINDIEKTIEEGDNLEYDADGLDSFGSFSITPSGTPVLSMVTSLPSITGLSFVTGPEGILVTLPDIFVFDTSALDPSLTFSAENNTLLIQGAIPASINLPITSLKVNPVQKEAGTKIVTSYAVTGKIVVPSADVNHSDLQGMTGAEFGITVNIPEITAESITLDEALSFEIDETYDMSFELGADLPLKTINEILLDEVYMTLTTSFTGLPDLGEGYYNVDLTLTLPSYMTPASIPIQGHIVDGSLPFEPVKLVKLSNIAVPEDGKIAGQIKLTGNVSAVGNDIDLSSIQSDINVDFTGALGNAAGKIAMSKATGVFSYSLEQGTTVKLDNLPEILRDDSLTPDLDDPQISLTIKSNLGIPMKGDLDIIPYKGAEVQEANKIQLHDIALPFSETANDTITKTFVVCKSATTAPADCVVLEADVTKLLTNIPDSLTINVKAAVDESTTSIVEPSANYALDIQYGITAPLAFGADFHFSTTTDIDISMIADYTAIGEFGIKGKAVNDTPLNLNVEMILLDPDEVVIPQSKPSTIAVRGSATSDIEFYLSPTDKTRKLSKARLVITVTAVEGVALTEESSLQLIDLAAVLPEGVTYSVPTK